jgi:hypothetical protein
MGDASALGAPVPFESDDYAQYELDRCRRDQNSFDQVLTVISIVAASTVLIQRIRNKEHRKFPDNIFTMMLYVLPHRLGDLGSVAWRKSHCSLSDLLFSV